MGKGEATMVVIVISGLMGSGKSTIAKLIQDYYIQQRGIEVYILKFAGALYEMHEACRAVLKKYNYQGYDYEKKDRNLLQLLGTEWGRETVSKNIWVNLLLSQIRSLPKRSIAIVDDCRFENEFDSLRGIPNLLTIRLEAARETRKERASMWSNREDHPSETGLNAYADQRLFDLRIVTEDITPEETFEKFIKGPIEMRIKKMEKMNDASKD